MSLYPELRVYTVGRGICPFRFNPLIPPENTDPRAWLKKLIEVMCHAYFLGEGVAFLLQKAIDQAYSNYGIYSGNSEEFPTFKDVLSILEKMQVKGRKALWMDSTLRTLGVLCFGKLNTNCAAELMLVVSDDGVGFPEGLDVEHTGTLGLQLVSTLTRQLEGTVEITRNSGTAVKVTFSAPA